MVFRMGGIEGAPAARMRRGLGGLAVVLVAGVAAVTATSASASTTHVVLPGETLSGIAAANGLTTESLAAWNGISAETFVIEGSSLAVPTAEEAGVGTTTATAAGAGGSHVVVAGESLSSIAAANGITVTDLASANGLSEAGILPEGATLAIPAATIATAAPAPGLGAITSPWGDLYLEATAAAQWNAMREQSLATYGQDLYPQGTLSAYRSTEQQSELYQLFLSGAGAPANPPGSSSHELGVSVDVATPEMRWVIDQIGAGYGWGKLEAPDEWWHVSYGG